MKILFICEYNRFRSKFAEAFFNKFNKNKKIKVKSAGYLKGAPIDKEIKKVAKDLGVNITPKPRKITNKLLKWCDLAIVVADDVPLKRLRKYSKKLRIWKISDIKKQNLGIKKRYKLAKKIKKRVIKLVKELKYTKHL